MTIVVENLTKQFRICHLPPTTLRETLTQGIKNLFRKKQDANTWENFNALQDLSFTVEAGSRFAILGKNGAGKSTLLKVLSRITPPTKGKIKMTGRVSSLLEVGTGFHPELTGKENIFLNGALLGMGRKEILRKFDEIVAFAEVERFLDTPVKRYSSGMYVRLAFAVAAHLDSEILILDEVLAVGDAKFQKKCLDRVEGMTGEGRTVLFVSHNMSSVSRLCNKGILLDKGKLVVSSSLEECIHLYHGKDQGKSSLVWEGNAGTQAFKVHQLKLTPLDDPYLIQRNSRGQITVEFTAFQDLYDVIMTFDISTIQGARLIQKRIRPGDDDHLPFHIKKGVHRVSLDLDFHLFTEGSYRIDLDISILRSHRIVQDVFITFDVIDSNKRVGDIQQILSPPWTSHFEKVE